MTAQQLYERNLSINSDIGGHMELLLKLGQQCHRITEFGVRGGNSTSCWLYALPSILRCYDWAIPTELELFHSVATMEGIDFEFRQADTSKLGDIEETDLLFLDTLHTAKQIELELKHHHRVGRYIVFHDTETNAWVGEGGQEGLKKTMIEFLLDKPVWRISEHHKHNNGLTVFERV